VVTDAVGEAGPVSASRRTVGESTRESPPPSRLWRRILERIRSAAVSIAAATRAMKGEVIVEPEEMSIRTFWSQRQSADALRPEVALWLVYLISPYFFNISLVCWIGKA
jgi:hypothetical protein